MLKAEMYFQKQKMGICGKAVGPCNRIGKMTKRGKDAVGANIQKDGLRSRN